MKKRKLLTFFMGLAAVLPGQNVKEGASAETPEGVSIVFSEDIFSLGSLTFKLDVPEPKEAEAVLESIYKTNIGKKILQPLGGKYIHLTTHPIGEGDIFSVPFPCNKKGKVLPDKLLEELVILRLNYEGRIDPTPLDSFFSQGVAYTVATEYKYDLGKLNEVQVAYYAYLKNKYDKEYNTRIIFGGDEVPRTESRLKMLKAILTEEVDPNFSQKEAFLKIIRAEKRNWAEKVKLNAVSDRLLTDEYSYIFRRILGISEKSFNELTGKKIKVTTEEGNSVSIAVSRINPARELFYLK